MKVTTTLVIILALLSLSKETEMFTYNYLGLRDEYNSEGKIKQMEEEAKRNNQFEGELKENILRAKGILAGAFLYDERREFTTNKYGSGTYLAQYGDIKSYVMQKLKSSWAGTNRQPTGVFARSGDEIIIHVEAEPTDKLPSIYFSQFNGYWGGGWLRAGPQLKLGKNVVTFPNIDTSSYSRPVAPGGPIYLSNPYTPAEQSQNVKVYFETGILFPIFRKGDDQDKYTKFCQDYLNYYLDYEKQGYFDMTELVGDRTIITLEARRAMGHYKVMGYDANENLEGWDEYLKQLLKFDGVKYDPSEEYYDEKNIHVGLNYRLSQPYGAAYAINEHVGIFGDNWLSTALIGKNFGWGFSHEIGHMFDVNGRTYIEATNNMISKYYEDAVSRQSTRGSFEESVLYLTPDGIEPMKRCKCGTEDCQFWKKIDINFLIWWHIESLFHGYWGKFDNIFRYARLADDSKMSNPEKQVLYTSLVIGHDVSAYFERWGYNFGGGDAVFTIAGASETFKNYMNQYKSQGKIDSKEYKFWYLDRLEYNYIADNGFVGCSYGDKTFEIERILKVGEKRYELFFPTSTCKGHLGYEILVDGVVKQFTYGTSAIVDNVEDSSSFSVIAYDRILEHSKQSTTKKYVTVSAACKIGSTNYPDLQSAFNAVTNGQTIELLTHISALQTLKFDKDISITITHSLPNDLYIYRTFAGTLFEILKGSVTIQGRQNARIILDGYYANSGRLILAKNNAQVTAKYITIQNTNTNDKGAGIQLEGSAQLNLSDSSAINCRADYGGAIHASAASTRATITNVVFEKDQSVTRGGAIRNTGTTTVTNCRFTESTGKYGAAISNDAGGVIEVVGSTFSNNEATNGIIYIDGKTTLNGCTITENHAENGGAIMQESGNDGRSLELLGNTKIFRNYATGKGGAINLNKGKAYFTSAEVYDNVPEGFDMSNVNINNVTELSGAAYISSTGKLYLTSGCKINGMIYKETSGEIIAKGSMPSGYNNQVITITFPKEETANIIKPENYQFTTADLNKVKVIFDLGSLAVNDAGVMTATFNKNIVVTIINKIGDSEIYSNETFTLNSLEYGKEMYMFDFMRVWDCAPETCKDDKGNNLEDPVKIYKNQTIILGFTRFVPITFDYLGVQYTDYGRGDEKFVLPFFRLYEKFNPETHCNIGYYIDELGDIYQKGDSFKCKGTKKFTAVFDNCYEVKFKSGNQVLNLKRVGFGYALELPKTINKKTINAWKDQNGIRYNSLEVVNVMEHMTFVEDTSVKAAIPYGPIE